MNPNHHPGRNPAAPPERSVSARPDAGFSLVECMVTFTLLVGILSAVVTGIRSGHEAAEEIRRRREVTLQASDFLDRMTRINYGAAADPAPAGAALTELFDDDDVLGGITLVSMRHAPGAAGYSFQMANFRYGGTWEVRVTADLNGDGDEADDAEGLTQILRVDILYAGRAVLTTLRAAPFA